jgi:WD40 repeat protein
MLASGSGGDQSVRVWDTSSGAMVAYVSHPDGAASGPLPRVPQVSFHPDGTHVAMTGFWDATVRVYNLVTGE